MQSKGSIRELYKKKRAGMSRADVAEKSRAAADMFLASALYKNASRIMLYMPLGNETDTEAIIAGAQADGKKMVFPMTNPETFEITPVLWDGESEFCKGAFLVKEPSGAKAADMNKIDVVIVPGIAFDKDGSRIGFGKGCYDRLLADSSAVKVGFCYDFQIVDNIPADKNDIKMDYILCESGWINCKED